MPVVGAWVVVEREVVLVAFWQVVLSWLEWLERVENDAETWFSIPGVSVWSEAVPVTDDIGGVEVVGLGVGDDDGGGGEVAELAFGGGLLPFGGVLALCF